MRFRAPEKKLAKAPSLEDTLDLLLLDIHHYSQLTGEIEGLQSRMVQIDGQLGVADLQTAVEARDPALAQAALELLVLDSLLKELHRQRRSLEEWPQLAADRRYHLGTNIGMRALDPSRMIRGTSRGRYATPLPPGREFTKEAHGVISRLDLSPASGGRMDLSSSGVVYIAQPLFDGKNHSSLFQVTSA